MDTIGLDLHKRESQLCIGHGDGTITERRIVTSRERFSTVLGGQAPARVLVGVQWTIGAVASTTAILTDTATDSDTGAGCLECHLPDECEGHWGAIYVHAGDRPKQPLRDCGGCSA